MRNVVDQQLGGRIAAYRRGAGLTQEELAERLRVAPETISRLERGVSVPSLKTVARIGKVLGVELRDLFDFASGKSAKVNALDALIRDLSHRSKEDIVLVHDIAQRVFRRLDIRTRGG